MPEPYQVWLQEREKRKQHLREMAEKIINQIWDLLPISKEENEEKQRREKERLVERLAEYALTIWEGEKFLGGFLETLGSKKKPKAGEKSGEELEGDAGAGKEIVEEFEGDAGAGKEIVEEFEGDAGADEKIAEESKARKKVVEWQLRHLGFLESEEGEQASIEDYVKEAKSIIEGIRNFLNQRVRAEDIVTQKGESVYDALTEFVEEGVLKKLPDKLNRVWFVAIMNLIEHYVDKEGRENPSKLAYIVLLLKDLVKVLEDKFRVPILSIGGEGEGESGSVSLEDIKRLLF